MEDENGERRMERGEKEWMKKGERKRNDEEERERRKETRIT